MASSAPWHQFYYFDCRLFTPLTFQEQPPPFPTNPQAFQYHIHQWAGLTPLSSCLKWWTPPSPEDSAGGESPSCQFKSSSWRRVFKTISSQISFVYGNIWPGFRCDRINTVCLRKWVRVRQKVFKTLWCFTPVSNQNQILGAIWPSQPCAATTQSQRDTAASFVTTLNSIFVSHACTI